ncbi:putative sulfate exporter family transporter [soil metagenome]
MKQIPKNTPALNPINLPPNIQKAIFIAMALLCLMPFVSAPVALLLGIVIANLIGNPFKALVAKGTKYLLQASIVGLGFGINAINAFQAGAQGFWFTLVSITATLLLGYLLGKLFKVDGKTSQLVSTGTAICGGSAIAAIAPIIQAEQKQISVALGIVFILNALALFLFPAIGHMLHLSQAQFGLWSAIAIHDTSSVVGAASTYGPEALAIATTVKLLRALWIIPLALGTALACRSHAGKTTIPYFIGWFVVAMLLNTYFQLVREISPYIVMLAKAGLTLTLFFIGAGLSYQMLLTVGPRSILQGVTLWVVVSILSLWAILAWG